MEFSTLNGYKVKDKKAIRYYDTVADMKADTTLKSGMHVKTKGYYSVNDGGHAEYTIKSSSDNYYESLTNNLVAELIFDNNILNVKQFGVKANGINDDTSKLQLCIDYARTNNSTVELHGIIYVTNTINTHGVYIKGDKQPISSGGYYPNEIGYDYAKNMNEGANITFNQYINDIVDGTAIISDVANPILSTDYDKGFNLDNFGVYGWLRNNTQEGLKVNEGEDVTYYPGRHFFNNFSVFNTGSNGIHLYSLEVSTINHLIIELTNGYGLFIEGLENTDCPTDYTKFNDCRFRYTRLSAFYSKNSYRQECEFNHCNFNYIGQNAFGECNDTYGERTQPASFNEIVYAIDIDGYNYAYGTPTRGLNIINCYGEQLNGLLTIHNVSTLTNLKMNSSSIVRSIGSTISCYANIDVRYLLELDIDYTVANVSNIYNLVNITHITSKGFLPNQFSSLVSNLTTLFRNDTKEGYKSFKSIYGDDIYSKNYISSPYVFHGFNTASGTETTVTMDLTDIIDEHFKYFFNDGTSGRPYSLGLLSLAPSGDSSTPAVADLVSITKHNSKYFITFLTSNTGATASTDGSVTITVPSWKVATFQFIHQIDNSIQ